MILLLCKCPSLARINETHPAASHGFLVASCCNDLGVQRSRLHCIQRTRNLS